MTRMEEMARRAHACFESLPEDQEQALQKPHLVRFVSGSLRLDGCKVQPEIVERQHDRLRREQQQLRHDQ